MSKWTKAKEMLQVMLDEERRLAPNIQFINLHIGFYTVQNLQLAIDAIEFVEKIQKEIPNAKDACD